MLMYRRRFLSETSEILDSKIMTHHTKNLRGSVLVFSRLVLFLLLSAALSTAAVVVSEKKSSRVSEKSVVAFQIADGAVENVLKRVYQHTDSTLNDLAGNLFGQSAGAASPECLNGVITGTLPSSNGTYAVTFFDNSGDVLGCGDAAWRTQLVRVKSAGIYAGTIRAIDVSIRP